MSEQQYVVLVPVKPPAIGKSRLVGLDPDVRRELAEAFAQDAVVACLEASLVGAVLVVTDDAHFSRALTALGAAAIPDGVSDDLNGSLRQAAAEAGRRWPGLVPVAMCADLPALRSADLDATLARVDPSRPWFVPDADGVGTTLYVAALDEFDPRFGPGSREEHLDTGARQLTGVPASVRQDVDNLADLRAASALGLGRRTAALAADLV
ncbi:2-phospho-L-lactate guanylyltransferase [Nocardioides mangrovi]|uniref:2-phospho-L-lactate guanylyltransferase n=1 Tax=Nocardioides mangrovi TaxID=2874580 RepID=A0ABS7U7X6_9ACTN|nr:2-phospho-L-lactate guanylyltransferase [Nocardioides mangrovi]MBZ5737079.1 2-phospho-L-lactate guanylyltransferase [Nocardioides mangrovi]